MTLRVLDDAAAVVESGAPPLERIVAGSPVFETWSTYESADGLSFVGLWRATPGAWRIVYTEWEYCELLEGVSTITAADGSARTFKAGDRFVLETGFEGIWEVVETTLKRYVITLPAEAL